MKTIEPYLVFNGNCAAAMKFYKDCLGGELFILPYEKAPAPEFKGIKDRVMHASLTSGVTELRASDSLPDKPVRQGDNFHLFLQCEGMPETEKAFSALAEKGTVTMPLQKVFWGGHFGTLTDRFGVRWDVQSSKAA